MVLFAPQTLSSCVRIPREGCWRAPGLGGTGAARGIGLEFARAYLAEGARVAIADIKRHAYVLEEGETHLPESIQKAFDNGRDVRTILKNNIKAGKTAGETYDLLVEKINDAGFTFMETFNQPTDDPALVDVIIGCHSVGNLGHDRGFVIGERRSGR